MMSMMTNIVLAQESLTRRVGFPYQNTLRFEQEVG